MRTAAVAESKMAGGEVQRGAGEDVTGIRTGAARPHHRVDFGFLQHGNLRLDQRALAVERTWEWLNNGDSYSLLGMDPILQEWSDRPEYQEFLDRNDEQVKRQQALYLAGVKARKRAASSQSSTSGL